MTTAWIVVIVVGAATVALKAVGPLVLGGRELPARFTGVIALLAPALLAALVVTQSLGADEGLVVDERLAGVAAGAGALALRAPLLAVVVVAAAVTAGTRALTG
ncbi:MAG: AzlD domain-containing protein [Gaiellaceae bacterium]